MTDILHLGCGVRPMAGAVNHDKVAHSPWVDVAHDLEAFPWPWGDSYISPQRMSMWSYHVLPIGKITRR